MAHVFVTGMAVLDFIFQVPELPAGGEKFQAHDVAIVGGGCAANAAVAVARLGGQASLAARLGCDAIGDMILSGLRAEAVDVACIDRGASARSGYSSICVSDDSARQIVNFRGAALKDDAGFVQFPPTVNVALADTRWLAGAARTLEIARARGIPGVLDAEAPLRLDQITGASHIAFSRRGLLGMTGEDDLSRALLAVSAQTDAWVCVTDGCAGIYFLQSGRVENIPGYPVDAVDTLGAGDVWHGAFALRLGEGAPETVAAEFANAAAALKCTRPGGGQGCPERSAVETFMARFSGSR